MRIAMRKFEWTRPARALPLRVSRAATVID